MVCIFMWFVWLYTVLDPTSVTRRCLLCLLRIAFEAIAGLWRWKYFVPRYCGQASFGSSVHPEVLEKIVCACNFLLQFGVGGLLMWIWIHTSSLTKEVYATMSHGLSAIFFKLTKIIHSCLISDAKFPFSKI